MKRKLISALITASLAVSAFGSASVWAETGSTTFSSYYGSNMDNTDVTDFATALSAKGWTGTTQVRATLEEFKGARDRNVLYWSGHGLTSGAMSYYDNDREYRCGEAPLNTGHWEYMHTAVVKNT